ncbi:ETHYLENE INSENSITIVE 3-like [Trifolium repens]|nr:ETHYLENE INSENSITIVE 3-like [Trifolium repens]
MEPGGCSKDKQVEEINFEEYARNISNDIKELEELHKDQEINENNLPSEKAKRRKMSRAIDNILKRMVRLVDQCNIEGFVYGIVPEDGKPISAASENLRYWWKEKVKFDRNGPAAIMKYKQEGGFQVFGSNENMFNRDHNYVSLRNLHDLPDTTLGPLLSCLMHSCDPPAKSYPLENAVPPPWWPKGDEEWWTQLDFKNDLGPPPYKKTHYLKKVWKVAVLVSIIKHISNIPKIRNIVHQNKNLQDKLSAKDAAILSAILNHEEFLEKEKNHPHELPPPNGSNEFPDMFHETHDYDVEGINDGGIGTSSINVPNDVDVVSFDANVKGKNNVVSNNLPQCVNMVFDANVHETNMVINNNLPHQSVDLVPSMANVQGINMANNNLPEYPNLVPIDEYVPRNDKVIRPIATKRAKFRIDGSYTCDSPQCPYHDDQFGFETMELRDYHQVNCSYRSNYFHDQGNIIGGSSNQGNNSIGSSSSGNPNK